MRCSWHRPAVPLSPASRSLWPAATSARGRAHIHIFVTGFGSFVGEALLRACDARGIAVTGIDARAGARADCAVADIRSPTLAEHIPENVDAVVHLAALSRDSDCRDSPAECFDINVMGTLNVIEAGAAEARPAVHFRVVRMGVWRLQW